MQVKETMCTSTRYVSPEASLIEAANKMRALDVSALPVHSARGDGLRLGFITDRDIACRAVATGMDPAITMVCDVMTRDPASYSGEHDVVKSVGP